MGHVYMLLWLQRIKRSILTAYGVGNNVKKVQLTNEDRVAIKGIYNYLNTKVIIKYIYMIMCIQTLSTISVAIAFGRYAENASTFVDDVFAGTLVSSVICHRCHTVCHIVSLYVTLSHCMSSCHTICHLVTLYIILSHCMSSCLTVCHLVTLFVILSHCMSYCHTIWHLITLYVTCHIVCHLVCHLVTLYVILSHHTSSCHTACHLDLPKVQRASPYPTFCPNNKQLSYPYKISEY